MSIPFISIIVPVYNAELYLCKCIDSILQQTFSSFELLLVDDGSSDSSLDILKSYDDSDPRIKVFHQENGGAGSARNLGIRHAKGDWIVFIDADDTVDNDYLEKLVIVSQNVDLALCGMKLFKGEKVTYSRIFLENVEKKSILSIEEMFQKLRLYSLSGPVCKLFKRSIIYSNNISFPVDLNLGEDTVFVYSYLKYANNAYILDEYHGYNVMLSQNEDSLTKKASPKDLIKGYSRIYSIGKSISKSRDKASIINLEGFYIDGLLQAINLDDKNHLLTRKDRYYCYDSISDVSNNKLLYKKMPLYFFLFKHLRAWSVYEFLNKLVYGK